MTQTDYVQKLLFEAELFFKNNDFTQAIALYQKVLAADEYHPLALQRTAEIYQKLNYPAKAIMAYEKLLFLNKDAIDLKKQLFHLYVKTRQPDRVIFLGKEILKDEPDSFDVHQELKNQYHQQKDNLLYLQELKTLSRIAPREVGILLELATVYIRMDDVSKAETVYQKVLELDPGKSKALVYLGKQAYQRKDYQRAIALLEKINPSEGYPGMFYLLASLWDSGEKNKASELVQFIPWGSLTQDEQKFIIPVLVYFATQKLTKKQWKIASGLIQKGYSIQPENVDLKALFARVTQLRKKQYFLWGSSAVLVCILFFVVHQAWKYQAIPYWEYRTQYYQAIKMDSQNNYDKIRLQYNTFLQKYPQGMLSDDIRRRINKLEEKQETEEINSAEKDEANNDYISALNQYSDFLQIHPNSALVAEVRDKKSKLLKKIPVTHETFDNSDLDNWQVTRGEWMVWENSLYQTTLGKGYHFITMGNPLWRNYILEVKAMKLVGSEGFLVGFRAQDKDHLLYWNLGGIGNTVSMIQQSFKITDLSSIVKNTQSPLSIEPDKWYRIKIIVSGDSATCYLDDEQILQYSGNELKDASAGQIALGTWDTKVLYADVKVTILE